MIAERISEDVAKTVCKYGQGHECCRYLGMSSEGWSCLKLTELRPYIDKRVESKTMGARGDNCEGRIE